ncbi:MAG: AAA family ATPase [Acidimicrobiia bacterium]
MGSQPSTIAELRSSGWTDRGVKEEIRQNLLARMRAGGELFPGIVGYDDTVLPALERAILAGHDMIILGERGQAKTRLIRRLVDLLDDQLPVIDSCEINDSPYAPVCASCRARVAAEGDSVGIRWIGPEDRFSEKLATPDTAVADLIGDVDPIRVAEGRYLSDELVIHYGLVPRTHRGIFSINELPDLPPRIQVSLLNILEERDIQIRGFTVRLPLDILMVATANPEDYTNRGRIITPLKDRFGSELRTHYPMDRLMEIDIMRQEAKSPAPGIEVVVPDFLEDVIAEFTHQIRGSGHVNQRSGVSVRLSISNFETLVASAIRRAVRTGVPKAVPRISDLAGLAQSSMGRVEFEGFEEGREAEILRRLLNHAVLEVFRENLMGFDFSPILEAFDAGLEIEVDDLSPAGGVLSQFAELDVSHLLLRLGMPGGGDEETASAIEFALEGLHLTRRLNKAGGTYSA